MDTRRSRQEAIDWAVVESREHPRNFHMVPIRADWPEHKIAGDCWCGPVCEGSFEKSFEDGGSMWIHRCVQ